MMSACHSRLLYATAGSWATWLHSVRGMDCSEGKHSGWKNVHTFPHVTPCECVPKRCVAFAALRCLVQGGNSDLTVCVYKWQHLHTRKRR